MNDEVYQNISNALSDTGTLITTLIVVITAVSITLVILVLSLSVHSRKREIGILLAVGIAKPAVVLQYVLETLLIAAAAFPLAYLSSRQAAGTLGTLFDKAVRKFMEMKTLTPTILHELVERIDVYQTQGTGKNRTQRLVIHYNFIGVLDMPEVEEYPDNVVLDSRQGVAVEYLVGKAG